MSFATPYRKFRAISTMAIVIVILLILFRLFLPSILKWYVNKTLAKIPGYYGHLEDIDVHLWRGAYEIINLDLRKVEDKVPVPFFRVASADLSVQWKELFHGALVGKIILVKPELNFVDSDDKTKSQTSIDKSWQDSVSELFPLKINFFGIHDGSVHFRNLDAQPPVDIYLSKIELTARNLTNSRDSYKKLLANVDMTGQPMGHGSFKFHIAFNPFAKQPTFDLESTLADLPLATLNSFVNYYGGVTTESGVANLYAECAAQQGAFRGYVKPFVTELHFKSFGDKGMTFGEKLKGGAGNLLGWVFKNSKEESVATKVDFNGTFDDVSVQTWTAIRFAFHHAFVKALPETLDHSVKLKNIQTPKKSKKKD
jgi:hypothetical protein